MSQLEIEMPPTCCGRLAMILVGEEKLVGNPIDFPEGEPMKPRRIRIQFGNPNRKGDVVMPHEYTFLYWCDEEDP